MSVVKLRPKEYDKRERAKNKRRTKASWFNYEPYQSILFCPPTPKGNLARMSRGIVKKGKMEGGMDIKIKEKAGVRIGKILPGLKEKEDCGGEDCFIHGRLIGRVWFTKIHV